MTINSLQLKKGKKVTNAKTKNLHLFPRPID